MDKKLAFQILGLSETKEEAQIRQRYLTLLKDTNPEDDAEGFKRLREAYEEALRFTRQQEEEEDVPQGEVGQWMQRVREIYRNILLRRDVENWQALFEEPVCVSLDTFLDARSQLLGFLTGHSFLPQTVWRAVDQAFHVMEDFDALKEELPVNFLKHIEYHVDTEDFLDYGLFEMQDGYLPESDEETDDYIREYFRTKNRLEDDETEGVSQSLSDMKRYGVYHPYEDVERLRLYIREEECEKGRKLAERLIEKYPEDGYVRVWTGKIFYDTGDKEKGFAQWEAVLSEEPDYYMAKYFAMHHLVEQKSWYQAGKYVDELIKVNRRDEELQTLQKQIDNELVPILRNTLDEGGTYEELSGKELRSFLGWRLFDLERYEDILTLLSEDGELEAEEDGLELKAWSLYRLERYQEAIPVYQAHLKCVEKNADEAEKKASKASQSHRLLGVCYFCTDHPEEGERETKTAIEMEPDARVRIDCNYYLADRYLSLKEYEKSTEICDEILEADDGFYPAYLVRQEACYHMRKAQQVVDDYYRAIELYAGFDRPYLYAAMIFYDYNQYKDALGVIERARDNQVAFSKRLRFQEAKILRMLSEDAEGRKRPLEILDALLKETEEASKEDEKKAAEDRDSLDRAELLFEKGLLFEGEEKLDTAIELVQQAMRLDPQEPYYALVLGNLLRDSGQYDKALVQYKRLEEVYHHTEYYFGMGVCCQMEEDWQQAAAYFTKAADQDETYRDVNLRLYRCYEKLYDLEYKRDYYDKAMYYINKQMEITENRGYRLWDRGNLYEDAMETALAVADYEAALAAGTVPEDEIYILWQNIGITYTNALQYEKGYEAYKRAVKTMAEKDTSAKGYRGMAECLWKMGDYEKAIACCREGLAIFPADSTLWDTLTTCYVRTKRLEEALRLQEERRKQLGDSEDYYCSIAETLIEMGKTEEGLAVFDDAKRSYFKRAADRQELAKLYQEWAGVLVDVAEYGKAAKKYQEAATLYEDNRQKFRVEWRIAKSYYMAGQREEAARWAKKALDRLAQCSVKEEDYLTYAKYAPVQSGWLAWCYLALGEKEKAKGIFERMEQLKPCAACAYKKCFESSLWLGCYYYSEGEFEKAAAQFQEASVRYGAVLLEAKFLLEKIQSGDSGHAQSKGTGKTQGAGQWQGVVARLFHKKTGPVK